MRMRALLHGAFKEYGDIIYVRALKTATMRGQAFICFKVLEQAVAAKDALNGIFVYRGHCCGCRCGHFLDEGGGGGGAGGGVAP